MAVRREKVILDLEDHLSTGMAKAAASTALLNRELDSISGQSMEFDRASTIYVRDTQAIGREADGASRSIDRFSGRIGLAADALLTLGPAAIPLGAVVIPGVTALSAGLGAAVVAAGSAVLAFQGVGDALDALNKAQLDPTTENLEAAEEAMKRISPAARDMVKQLDSLGALRKQLTDAGADALFPDLIDALDTIVERGPEFEAIIRAVNTELGDIAADAATSLTSKRWDDFFTMVERRAPGALDGMADGLGNVLHGLSEIIEAFVPLNRDGMEWLIDTTEGFDKWATGLKKTEGFKAFSDYIRRNGPQLADTLAAVSGAIVDIVQAAAPLGGPALGAIESMAEVISKIADSDFATPLLAAIAAMRTINRLAPATAGSLALLGAGGRGGAAAAAAGGKGGRRSGRRGVGGGTALAAFLGVDIIAEQLGWEEVTEREKKSAEKFAKDWGQAWQDAAEDARIALSDALKVSTGKGPFGLIANDEGLTNALLNGPLEKRVKLLKEIRQEYGVGLRELEKQGHVLEGTTRKFRQQRDSVDALANDVTRMGQLKASPKIDLDDKAAKAKQRENEDWIFGWGRKNAAAKAGLDDRPRRQKSREADDWILQWGRENAEARADVDTRPGLAALGLIKGELNSLDGKVVTTTVRTRHELVGSTAGTAANPTLNADGGSVPKTGLPYADRHPYLLADGEEVISNRHGQADRHRSLLKAINAGRLADGGTTGMADRSLFGWSDKVGGPWGDAFENFATKWIPKLIKAADSQVDAASTQKDAAQSLVDGTKGLMASLADATTSGFQTGLFETQTTPGDAPWSVGARGPQTTGGWLDNLSTDIAGLTKRGDLQAQLALAGLDGAALDAALSQGTNEDLSALLASGQVQQFENMFNQRAALTASVGGAAGEFAYGAQLTSQTASLDQATAHLAAMEATVNRLERRLERAESISAARADRREALADQRQERATRERNQTARRRRRDR